MRHYDYIKAENVSEECDECHAAAGTYVHTIEGDVDETDLIEVRTLILSHNGDPYGSGFTASEVTDHGLFYRGDIGPMSRAFWRVYARRNGYTLREA